MKQCEWYMWYWLLLITTQVFVQQENYHAWNKIPALHQFLAITYLINWQRAGWYVNVIRKHCGLSHIIFKYSLNSFFSSHTFYPFCDSCCHVFSHKIHSKPDTCIFISSSFPHTLLTSSRLWSSAKLTGINLLIVYLRSFQLYLTWVTLSLSIFLSQTHAHTISPKSLLLKGHVAAV